MNNNAVIKPEYDVYSAVTFLLVGLGIGAMLAIVFDPLNKPGIRQQSNR